MEAINRLTLAELKSEDVFTFKVAMCDNDIDRDYEAFTVDALKSLKDMFVGKTVVKDHDHRSDNQIARIYETELVETGEKTKSGENLVQLVAKCYMVKTAANEGIIAEIKGGIKKEVSVGCSIKSAVCSICGTDNALKGCAHWHGKTYEGVECYFMLDGAADAYELSFVAVPAQRKAGTTKSYIEKAEQPEEEEDKPEDKPEEPEEEPEGEPEEEPEEDEDKKKALELRMKMNDNFVFLKKRKG